jgi:hypothetical protein
MGDDGVAVGDCTPCIRSNPKPLSLDKQSRAALASVGARQLPSATIDLVAPSELGSVVAIDEERPVRAIVRPSFRAGAITTLTSMSSASGAVLLADQSFNFVDLAETALHAVARLARNAEALVLEFSDLGDAVGALQNAVGISSRASA